MTNKNAYLRMCVKDRNVLRKRRWYANALAIPMNTPEKDIKDLGYLDLISKPDGMYYIDESGEHVKLDGYKKDRPLFELTDTIDVDKQTMSNIPKEMNIPIGTLIINAVVVPVELESKMPFMTGVITAKKIEKEISSRVRNPDDIQLPDSITVKDMIGMINSLNLFNSLGTIISTAATERSISRATGISDYVNKLVEEVGDEIKDPVKLVEVENKVREYDRKYLEGDPVATNLYTGKSEIGRFKMDGMYGAGLDFINDRSNDTVVIKPIGDGIDPDPNELPKYFNDLRYASFSRGDNTALAGVIYKDMQRSLASIRITPEPCNTKEGIKKIMTKSEIAYSVGRYIKSDGKWKMIPSLDEAKKLYGKEVEMRSPRTCTEKGNAICYACVSARYKHLANGVSTMASDISSTLLHMFLKLMHGTKTTVTDIDIEDLIR